MIFQQLKSTIQLDLFLNSRQYTSRRSDYLLWDIISISSCFMSWRGGTSGESSPQNLFTGWKVSIKINVIRCNSHQIHDLNKIHNWQEFFCVLSLHSKYPFWSSPPSAIMKLTFNLSQDENYRRIKGYLLDGTRALPGSTGRYLIQKVPVVQ